MMPLLHRLIQHPWLGKFLLALLAGVYVMYLLAFGSALYTSYISGPASVAAVIEHSEDTTNVAQHWTMAAMLNATEADEQLNSASDLPQRDFDISQGAPAQQDGQAPSSGERSYPLSTIGKIFFSDSAGHDYVCSGTAIVSSNHNTVDTAGHCLYGTRGWSQNVIFCPLYNNGNTPYGCWAARALDVPAGWINAKPNDLHQDFGMAIVTATSKGNLTDMVGGAGWAYNQPINQPFYAYGYPAGAPFNGQTRQACDKGSTGTSWRHGGGTVVSIPCNMTGGSSGGGWFIKMNGNWYLNGHNDFTSTMQRGHMFSPYYEDTWFALYNKAQNS